MNVVYYLLGVLCLLILAGCDQRAPSVAGAPTGNAHYTVDLIFNKDGVSIYRFNDKGEWRYYAIRERGELVAVDGSYHYYRSESCGKNCTRQVRVDVPNNLMVAP